MYTPNADEKLTPVMVYTRESVFRGEVITKQNVRVSTWLRTQGAPRYIHLLRANSVQFSGAVKSANHSEVFIPLPMVIAFHLVPPASDGVDYDPQEANRAMLPILTGVGTFQFKGVIRVSAQSGIGPSLELSKIPWMSLYDLEITNPVVPQMPALRVPLAIVNPEQVTFSIP
ncbi:MAG: hypothetical protein N2117_14040 [Anaerolineales bacterium]|nr:hypothetical protein [Anaerolineales bacterium]MCX7756346.1 hypothetical protein [Anaerolineales bacterium]MDW8276680.1 hypothetical protein [Anaerolineales bacterium]